MVSSGVLFDYISWTLDAAWQKVQFSALGMPDYLTYEQQKLVVYDYIQVTRDIEATETELDQLYADPAIEDKEATTEDLRIKLRTSPSVKKTWPLWQRQSSKSQVATVVSELGLNHRRAANPFSPVSCLSPPFGA